MRARPTSGKLLIQCTDSLIVFVGQDPKHHVICSFCFVLFYGQLNGGAGEGGVAILYDLPISSKYSSFPPSPRAFEALVISSWAFGPYLWLTTLDIRL